MCVCNRQNADFGDLPYYGDQRLIAGWRIYCVNDDIIGMLSNCLIIDIYKNQM